MSPKIREYNEGLDVAVYQIEVGRQKRWIIEAYNEAGCCCTQVDLEDILDWIAEYQPEMLD